MSFAQLKEPYQDLKLNYPIVCYLEYLVGKDALLKQIYFYVFALKDIFYLHIFSYQPSNPQKINIAHIFCRYSKHTNSKEKKLSKGLQTYSQVCPITQNLTEFESFLANKNMKDVVQDIKRTTEKGNNHFHY